MSILKVDAIRHNSATSAAITMASDGTCTAKVTSINGGSALSHRNILINGSCAISQRGTSFSGTGFTLDRYYVGSGDYSVAQVTDAPSNSGLTYSLRVSRTASTTGYLTFQMIELPATGQAGQFYNGAKFTFSGYVKGTSGATITPTLRFSTGTGGSNGSSFTRTEGAFTCNGSWQPFTFHFTVDENVGGSDKCVQSYFTFVTTATGQNVFFTGLQLEAGDTAPSFAHRSVGEELVRCQRYFAIFPGRSGGIPFWQGYMGSSDGYCSITVPNFNMRAVPTPTDASTGTSSSTGNIYDVYGNNINSRFAGNGTVTLSCGGYAPSGIGLIMNFGTHQSGTKEGVCASWNGGSPGIFLSPEL